MRIIFVGLIAAFALSSCSGPKQRAGEKQDKAQAAAAGVPYSGEGPNERAGKAQDKIDAAHSDAADAQADALIAQGKQVRATADAQAERLEQQAKQIRAAARNQAQDLNDQAKAAKSQ
ncbi:hypothetical protein WBP06_04100 [Novosphingobium sp. BL-8H]|uniref:hypothetical protein n=1 Tax=Novosphingobium sp. BL-8H TaxID=3127640 RepID=UPI003757669B